MAVMTHRAPSSSTLHSSYSVSSSSCVAPPPTCNLLDAAQRSRLIKSTRKLGKVLGTTPYVLEEDEPRGSCSTPSSSRSASPTRKRSCDTVVDPSTSTRRVCVTSSFDISYARSQVQTTALTRCRSLSGASTTCTTSDADSTVAFLSSQSRLNQSSKRESLALPPVPGPSGRQSSSQQPILRLPTLVSTSTHVPAAAAPSSPLGTTFPVPPSSPTSSSSSPLSVSSSPLTPFDSTTSLSAPSEYSDSDIDLVSVDEARIRKRRMEKLMRHLGECVPTELVFGPASKPSGTSLKRPATAPAPKPEDEKLERPQLKQLRRTSVSIISGPVPASLSRSASALSGHIMHRTSQTVREDVELTGGGGYMKEESRDEGVVRHLVDDEWTPAAYQDVVRRLRALK